MELKKKEELLKVNLSIFEDLDDAEINYILGYVSGMVLAKKKEKRIN